MNNQPNDMLFDAKEKKKMYKVKPITFTIPHLGTKVQWNNTDRTYIVGINGTGKTLLLGEMMKWCDTKGYEYAHYDAVYALLEAPDLIANSSDADIIWACKMLSEFSYDFNDDIIGWAKATGSKDPHKDAKHLRHVLGMCGAGYTRMFVMTIKAIQNPNAAYYFLDLPETSVHLMIVRSLYGYIMRNFEYMKVVTVTHSPEIIADVWTNDGQRDYTNIIEMPVGTVQAADDHKFNEYFA